MGKPTPGPWYWTKQFTGSWALMGGRSLLVMDVIRSGMQGAQVRFSDRNGELRGGIMHNSDALDLNQHPDARLMAASTSLLAAAKCALASLTQNATFPADIRSAVNTLRDAIAEADPDFSTTVENTVQPETQ